MHPPIRTRNDGKSDVVSAATATVFDPDEDRARQEFKDETDVNVILRRFGAGALAGRTPRYAEVDFDTDLLTARLAVNEVGESISKTFPPEVIAAYGGVPGVLASIAQGTFKFPAPASPAGAESAGSSADAAAAGDKPPAGGASA